LRESGFLLSCIASGYRSDGSQHYSEEGLKADKIRDDYLQSLGLKVLRFNDYDVLTNISGVVENILENMK
jgi:very-short-patch-repair endonuclease